MTRRKPFVPDITIGELLLLSQLSHATYVKPVANPAQTIIKRRGISITVLRNVLTRVRNAVGPIEMEGGQRRTLRPNEHGRNMGAIGFLAGRLCEMAMDPSVDNARLLAAITAMTGQLEKFYEDGGLASPTHDEAD